MVHRCRSVRTMLRFWPAALAAVLVAGAVQRAACGQERVMARFEQSDELAMNPDCGWVAYSYEDGYGLRRRAAGGREPYALASVVYTRHPRNAWDGPDGGFEGSRPLRVLESWMGNGRHVGFRVYANTPTALPEALKGEPVVFPVEGGGALRYWEERYVEDHRRLVQFLGERLGDSPYLAFVDVGAVGNTGGEWHFEPVERYRAAGMDEETVYEMVRTFVQMYREAFPGVRLFIGYDCLAHSGSRRGDVLKVLVENGVGLRDDGLGGWPYPQGDPSAEGWPVRDLWPRLPVAFEGSGRGGGVWGWRLQGKDPGQVLEWAFRLCPPTYVNLAGSETGSQKACDEMEGVLRDYGLRVGYRFALLEASCPPTLGAGRVEQLRTVWANRGAAPCYADRRIEVSLFDDEGRLALVLPAAPQPPTSRWAPGEQVTVEAPFSVPPTLAPGSYTLKVSLLWDDPRAPGRRVQVSTRGADAAGRFTVGTVRVER